jgi:hypothetical protein
MSTLTRHGLQIDDPLGPSQSAQGNERPTGPPVPTPSQAIEGRPVEASDRGSQLRQRGEPEGARQPATVERYETATRERAGQPNSAVWRVWSGISSVGSFRLPHELLVELGDTARELQLPVGMIVTAAIAQLLDRPPEEIAALVDKADDARIHGRRTARRRLTERPGG